VLTIYTGENGEGMFFENKAKPIDTEKPKKSNLTVLD
jgi:stringent starvation protein B